MSQAVAISVIVPCYNVENYIEQSIASLCGQTFSNIEIICIDDGSTDGTLGKLKELSSCDPRIQIIQQKNSGPYYARLRGFRLARGEWIAFVDADDEVEPNHLEGLYAGLETGVDIVVCGYTHIKIDGSTYKLFPPFDRITAVDAAKLLLTRGHRTVLYYNWNKLYRRNLVLETALERLHINCGEDQILNLCTFAGMKDAIVKAVPQATYRYYARPGSITRTMSYRHMENFFLLCAEKNLFANQLLAGDADLWRSYEHLRTMYVMDVFGDVYRSGNASLATAFIAKLHMVDWKMKGLYRPILFMRWLKFQLRKTCAGHGWFPGLLR